MRRRARTIAKKKRFGHSRYTSARAPSASVANYPASLVTEVGR